MYGIALSVTACLRAGTRVDVAWIVDRRLGEALDPTEAIAITPGGGRLGSLLSGALDGQLLEWAGVLSSRGRLLRLDIGPADASVSGVQPAVGIVCILVPGTEMPEGLWDRLLAREPVCLVSHLEGDTVTRTDLYSARTISEAGNDVQQIFERESSTAEVLDDTVVTVLWPRSTVVVVGGGHIAEAVERIAQLLGWQAVVTGNAGEATGLIAALASLDSVVVLGHDLELSGRALMAALTSAAGYVGAVGPNRLQESRADWLAYRGFTDLSRIHGPAGLDIGARTPQEVALAIAAEIVATQTTRLPDAGVDDTRPLGEW